MALLLYSIYSDFIIELFPVNRYNSKKIRENININIYLFDALSRFRFINQMIYTKKYLNSLSNKYKIYEMMKYHTLGVNSPINYKFLFQGNNSVSLFKWFYSHNYSTAAIPGYYDYDLSFYGRSNRKYVDYNIQLFRNSTHGELYGKKIRCFGNKQRHKHQLEMLESIYFNNQKNNISTFSFTSFMESHDESFISLLRMDKDFANHLKQMEEGELLQESVTIIMADHGMHYGKYFNTTV